MKSKQRQQPTVGARAGGPGRPGLAQLDSQIFDCAQSIIAAGGGEHTPMVFVLDDSGEGKVVDVGFLMVNDGGKELVCGIINSLMKQPTVEMVAFICEAWGVTAEQDSPAAKRYEAGMRPSQDPERIELLQVAYSMKGGKRAQVAHRIYRSDGAAENAPRRLERGELVTESNDNTLAGRFFADRPASDVH